MNRSDKWKLALALLVMVEVALLASFGTLKPCGIARQKVERNSFGLATLPNTVSVWDCTKIALSDW